MPKGTLTIHGPCRRRQEARPFRAVLLAIAVMTAAAPPAAAQVGHELSGGYSRMSRFFIFSARSRYTFEDPYDFSYAGEPVHHGFAVAYTLQATPTLGLVADVAAYEGVHAEVRLRLGSLMVGPQLTIGRGRTRVMLHALAGSVSYEELVRVSPRQTVASPDAEKGVLVGAAVDRRIGSRWGLRVSAAYLVFENVNGGPDPDVREYTVVTEGQPRLVLGVSYRLREPKPAAR